MRAAFVYPWFPETWKTTPAYTPSLGQYSSDLGIAQAHIAMLRYAKCRAGIASWWGPQSPYSPRIDILLKAAEGTKFKWCLYYEREGYGDPSPAELVGDLDFARQWTAHPNYLRIKGKPVIFAYAASNDGAQMAARWEAASAGKWHVCLKLFHGFEDALAQPDSWHEYAPANPISDFRPYSVSVSPGFAMSGQPVRLERDVDRFRADVKTMNESAAFWNLVTTFNEWGEGTAVEPALEYGTVYLDALAGKR